MQESRRVFSTALHCARCGADAGEKGFMYVGSLFCCGRCEERSAAFLPDLKIGDPIAILAGVFAGFWGTVADPMPGQPVVRVKLELPGNPPVAKPEVFRLDIVPIKKR